MALRRTSLIVATLACAAVGVGRSAEGQETPFGGRTLPNVSPGTQAPPNRTLTGPPQGAGYQGWYQGAMPQAQGAQQLPPPQGYAQPGQAPANYVGPPPSAAQAPPAEGGMLFAAPPAPPAQQSPARPLPRAALPAPRCPRRQCSPISPDQPTPGLPAGPAPARPALHRPAP